MESLDNMKIMMASSFVAFTSSALLVFHPKCRKLLPFDTEWWSNLYFNLKFAFTRIEFYFILLLLFGVILLGFMIHRTYQYYQRFLADAERRVRNNNIRFHMERLERETEIIRQRIERNIRAITQNTQRRNVGQRRH